MYLCVPDWVRDDDGENHISAQATAIIIVNEVVDTIQVINIHNLMTTQMATIYINPLMHRFASRWANF